jgi:hypothetical protein
MPISARTFPGSGHNTCHQSASGIAVAGKKPFVIRQQRAWMSFAFDNHSIIRVNDPYMVLDVKPRS